MSNERLIGLALAIVLILCVILLADSGPVPPGQYPPDAEQTPYGLRSR